MPVAGATRSSTAAAATVESVRARAAPAACVLPLHVFLLLARPLQVPWTEIFAPGTLAAPATRVSRGAASDTGPAAASATLTLAGAVRRQKAGTDASSAAAPPASEPVMRFEDVTRASGITFRYTTDLRRGRTIATIGGGVAAADLDGDGLPELFFTGGVRDGRHPERGPSSVLYWNRGDGTFEDRTERSGAGETGWLMGAYFADLDADGSPDLLLTSADSVRLLRNVGSGRFRKIPDAGGIVDGGWSVAAAFPDANRDGLLDVFIGNYLDTDVTRERKSPLFQLRTPDDYPGLPDALFLQKEGGRFADATDASGLSPRESKTLGACAEDLDGDGIADILVANDRTPNQVYRGLGNGTFEDVAAAWGLDEISGRTGPRAGMGVAVGDPDGDGDPDIVVTNFGGEPVTYYRNSGAGLFEDAADEAGLSGTLPYVQWGAQLEDLDNDGNPDLTIVSGHLVPKFLMMMAGLFTKGGAGPFGKGSRSYRQPAMLYRGLAGGSFQDVTAASGDLGRVHISGRGSVAADFDGDGRLDLAIHAVSGGVRLLRNVTEGAGSAIEILPEAGPPAQPGRPSATVVGTKIAVTAGGRRWVREFTVRSSYASGSWLPLHFGLGAARIVDRVEIFRPGETAPSGVFTNVLPGALYGAGPSGLRLVRTFRAAHGGAESSFPGSSRKTK